MEKQKEADRIREYLKQHFVDPARLQGMTIVRVVAGDIHKELGLRNQVPNVCQVLRSKKFLNENRLVLEKFEGPPSGLGTTATFTYRLRGWISNSEQGIVVPSPARRRQGYFCRPRRRRAVHSRRAGSI